MLYLFIQMDYTTPVQAEQTTGTKSEELVVGTSATSTTGHPQRYYDKRQVCHNTIVIIMSITYYNYEIIYNAFVVQYVHGLTQAHVVSTCQVYH